LVQPSKRPVTPRLFRLAGLSDHVANRPDQDSACGLTPVYEYLARGRQRLRPGAARQRPIVLTPAVELRSWRQRMGTGNLHEELGVCLTSWCTYALEPSSAFSGCTNESAARQTTSHTLSRPMHGLQW